MNYSTCIKIKIVINILPLLLLLNVMKVNKKLLKI